MSQVTRESFPLGEKKNSSTDISKPTLESYRLAELAVQEELSGEENNPTLKQYWVDLGNQLEIEGISKEKICSVAARLLVEKKAEKLKLPIDEIKPSGYFYRVFQDHDWVDTNLGRPRKDKDPKPKPKNNFEQENDSWLAAIEKLEDFLKTQKSYLKNHNFNSLIPKKQSNESLLIINSVIDHCNERLNNKTKIHPSHYSILLRDSIYASGTKLSQDYYEHVKEKEGFTDKQSHKVVKAIMKDMPARYEPNSEDQSIACGFSGVPCPGCDSYRTEYTSSIEKIVYEDTIGNKYEHGIKVRRIKCYAEDEKEYLAPMPKLPAAEISQSDW